MNVICQSWEPYLSDWISLMTKRRVKIRKYDNRLKQIIWQLYPVWFDLFKPVLTIKSKSKVRLDTHDWNYDKHYEWGLETLTGKTFFKNKIFEGEENLFLRGLSLMSQMYKKKKKKRIFNFTFVLYIYSKTSYPT